ncbi:uncharacterized protein LOC119067203 [Bradysia coprophila]|uniref:uncharacterized protein LOC119067203 n=1 Tax=Bradysia coprophila TaxID=38358 RepID=UPI00187DD15C|nr:uncharacterized protein LOC119067203 [Bradysia coprophila]
MNAPAHYFGVHHNCRKYFCTKSTTEAAIDNLKALKEDGLYYEVLNLCQQYFGGNAKSLLENYTNNAAEQFNNIVAKFIGGKRINFSLGGSYTARVAAAVVQYNSKGHSSTEFRKYKFGSVQSARLENMENGRKRKILQNAIALQSRPRNRRGNQDNSAKGSGAYYHGEGTEDIDMEPAVFEKAKKVFLEKLMFNQRNRNDVEESTRGGKHNSRWQQIRQDLVPSSFVPKIVLSKTKKSYKNHLDELVYKRSEFGNSATIKHQRLVERDALQFFQTLFDDTLHDCGLFIDKEIFFLCASPLKLYGNDHTLNIKCPLKEYGKKFDEVIHKLPFWDKKGNLNTKHEWYVELQCELRATGRKYGFLMFWLGLCEETPQYRIIEVPKNDSFFDTEVTPKLNYFYNEVMVKELVDSRKQRNMALREYDPKKNIFI